MLIQIWFGSTSTKLLSFGLAAESFSKKHSSSFLFAMAVGGDAAPGAGMAMLVSFLNVGE